MRNRTIAVLMGPAALFAAAMLGGSNAAAIPGPPPGCTIPAASAVNTTPQGIPDLTTVTSTVNVTETRPLRWVRVTTDIDHTFPGDLDIVLESPTGTDITLTTDNGNSNDDIFAGTTWDDDAGEAPGGGGVTDHGFTNGVVAPLLSPEEPLSALAGESPSGTWTLTVTDDDDPDAGTLNSWTLEYGVIGTGPVMTNGVAYGATSAAPIPDLGTVTRSIDVTMPLGGTVERISPTVFLPHTFSNDLDVTLTSPSGTVVTLTTDNGSGNDNVFNGTFFDDDAGATNAPGPVTDVAYANGVVETAVSPEEPLGAFRGETPEGVWTLTAADDVAGEVGTAAFSLNLLTTSCGNELAMTGTSAPSTVEVGGTIAYAMTITNLAAGDVSGVTLTDALPAGLELVSATPSQGTCTGTVSCTLGLLRVRDNAQVVVVARAKTAGTQANAASLTQDGTDVNAANDSVAFSTTVTPKAPGDAPPPPAVIPDTTKPGLVLLATSGRLKALRTKGLAALLGGTEAGGVVLRLRLPAKVAKRLKIGRTIGTASATLADPSTQRVTIRLTPRAARALRRVRSVRVTVVGALTDAAGNAGTARATARFRR